MTSEIEVQQDARKIIKNGDIDHLINVAEKLGQRLSANDLSKTQIRNIFGEVRAIEMNWQGEQNNDLAFRRVVLLKPKLRYAIARREAGSSESLKELVDSLSACISEIQSVNIDERRKCFGYFVDFFEAILANHVYQLKLKEIQRRQNNSRSDQRHR